MISFLGINFHLYGLLIGLGIYFAYEVAIRVAQKNNLGKEIIDKSFWWVVIMGIMGARIYHVIDFWKEYYSIYPIKVIYLWEGGLGIWGAIIGGFLGILIVWILNKKKFDLWKLVDAVATGMPVAQAIGRWGNYANDELWGKNREPLFFYESILNLFLFGLMVRMMIKNPKIENGILSGIYLVGYGIIRIGLEPMRHGNWLIGELPVATLVGIIAVLVGNIIIWKKRG